MGSPNIDDEKIRRILVENLKELLEKKGWSETELARRSGVSQKHINNVIRERPSKPGAKPTGLTTEAVALIAAAFSLPAWQLLIERRAKFSGDARRLNRLVETYLAADLSARKSLDQFVEKLSKN